VAEERGGHWMMAVGERTVTVSLEWRPGQHLALATIDDRAIAVQVDPVSEGFLLTHGGFQVQALVRTRKAAELAARMPPKQPPDTSRLLLSPMPGLMVSIAVAPGDEVKAGQELAVLEAMKMENVLRAERDGTVEEVRVSAGATVAADEVLIAFAHAAHGS